MIGRLNHVAIAVPDLEKATAFYRDVLGGTASEPQDLPDHGVTTVFILLPNTKIELICPLGSNSPILSFLEKHPQGGIHHVCFDVPDVETAAERIQQAGVRTLGAAKTGAHGLPVIFLHPKDSLGCLIELENQAG